MESKIKSHTKVIFTSSSAIYGTVKKKIDENFIASKKSMEELMKNATNFTEETEKAGVNLQKIKENI